MRKSPTALDVDNLTANMMAIKSFFMNEIYELKQEISTLQLQLHHKKLNQSGNNNVCEKEEKIIIEDLKTKLGFYQRKNQLLKDEKMTKQRTIETILYQNNELLKLDQFITRMLSKKPSLVRLKKK